jgi:N-acetylglucosaminyldiphosphoundecaprenol N-acetyl-beta-D-mannosaminyltransferase
MSSAVNIFGMDICSITFDRAVEILLGWLESGETGRFVVTPNVNHLVLYQDNSCFREAYRHASLVLPDGRYVILLSKMLGQPLSEPVNGSDLVPALMQSSENRGRLSVFLLGAMPGVAEAAANKIQARWPHVRVVGIYSPPMGFDADPIESRKIVERVNDVSPDLLVVGISPPRQEIWVSKYSPQIRAAVTICAGATIDFLAGAKPRAPAWAQRSGLEWLHRTLSEPTRLAPRYFKDGIAVMRMLYREARDRSRR